MTLGAGAYAKLLARASRRTLIGWPLGVLLAVVVTAASIVGVYNTPEKIADYQKSMEIVPIMRAFIGPSVDLDSTAGIVVNEMAIIAIFVVGLAGMMLAIGRTRGEEQAGRLDLVSTAPISRSSLYWGAVIATLGSIALTGLLVFGVLAAFGLPIGGSAKYGLLMALYALFWAGVGFCFAQVVDSTRTATTLSLFTLLVLYLLRTAVDGAGHHIAWLTPISWMLGARSFGPTQWWAYAALALGGAVLIYLASVLNSRRDLGSGSVNFDGGRASAGRWAGTPASLAWRLTKGGFYGYLVGAVLFSALIGFMAQTWTEVMALNSEWVTIMGFKDASQFSAFGGMIAAVIAAAAGISVIGTFAKEEKSGRLSLTASKPVTRVKMFASWIAVAVAQVVVLSLVSGLMLTIGGRFSGTNDLDGSVGVMAVYIVPALVLTTLAALGHGLHVGLHALGWAFVAWMGVVASVRGGLNLPEFILDLSPLHAIGTLPVDSVSWIAFATQLARSVIFFVGALWFFQRRDLREG